MSTEIATSENAARSATAAQREKRVLVVSTCFPSRIQPVYGVFVKERIRFVSQIPGVDVRVISPTPYFPPIKYFKRWYPWSQIPRREEIDGIEVERPRYFLPPKIGGYLHPQLMSPCVTRAARSLSDTFDFDIIDSHFVYPNGVVAAWLGKRLGKPVVITGRGEDMLRFPDLPVIGNQIRFALQAATGLIALSEEIADAMRQNGADPRKITVIPNGVNCDKFRPVPIDQARRRLGLPTDRPVIISVGYRIERKGFHILIDAIPKIREQLPNVLVVIVGGQARWADDYLPVIEERIRIQGLENHVLIAGNRPQEELAIWYSAADLFALLTSREGSPNVLMEALACGVPAVATPIGGIPDVLRDSRLGVLLPERTAEAAAKGLANAMRQQWNREDIRHAMELRGWEQTAAQVDQVFEKTLSDFKRNRHQSW
jgi:glycosyltransferase involved in cell wall biosynthesis